MTKEALAKFTTKELRQEIERREFADSLRAIESDMRDWPAWKRAMFDYDPEIRLPGKYRVR